MFVCWSRDARDLTLSHCVDLVLCGRTNCDRVFRLTGTDRSRDANVFFLTSVSVAFQVIWRPVLWGFTLQFVIGLLVLRWQAGYDAVSWASDQIMKFIYYSLEGAAVTFGDPFLILHAFVFVVSGSCHHLRNCISSGC